MREKLWFGWVAFAVIAIGIVGLLVYQLFREAETALFGVRTTATVLTFDYAVEEPRHVLTYTWDGRPRETTTTWLPDNARRGTVIDVVVSRVDPGFVIAAGTVGQRYSGYARTTFCLGGSALTVSLLFRAWYRHEYPPANSRPRISPGTPPSRAERRARRKRARRGSVERS